MNHRDTDYLYISTRLKARSQNLFSREKLNRLIAARTGEDAVKLLTENGWAAFAPDDLSACEAEIARQQQESFELLYRYAPDRRMIDLFRLKYDYHNLKSVIKADALGSDPSPLLSAAGTIPPAALLFAAREHDWAKLPGAMKQAAAEAADLLARTGDPQLSDLASRPGDDRPDARNGAGIRKQLPARLCPPDDRPAKFAGADPAARAKKGYDYLKRAVFPGGGVTVAGLTGEITPSCCGQSFAAASFSAPVEAACAALSGGQSRSPRSRLRQRVDFLPAHLRPCSLRRGAGHRISSCKGSRACLGSHRDGRASCGPYPRTDYRKAEDQLCIRQPSLGTDRA